MKEKIKSWLEKTGYPLELHVHHAVLASGYVCEKSQLYSDISTGNAREIDLVAYLNTDHKGKDFFYEVQLVVECKKSEKPLVILSSDGETKERYEHYFGTEVIGDFKLGNGATYFNLHKLPESVRKEKIGRFSEAVRAGYSIISSFAQSDENIYKGVMGLATASEYYRKQYIELAESEQNEPWFRMQLPILAVDAPLFVAYLNEVGDLSIEETNWASLLVRMPWTMDRQDQDRLCNVQVVRKEYFNDFLSEIAKFHRYLIDSDSVLFEKKSKSTGRCGQSLE